MADFKANPDFLPSMQRAVVEGNNAFLLVLARSLRVQLGKRGSGRVYRVAKGRKRGKNLRARGKHQASAPGEPPAPDTGTLRRSWQIGHEDNRVEKYAEENWMKIGIRFGSALHYARIDGGYGRVKPRPYIEPTLRAIRDLHAVAMQRAIYAATRRAR